MKKVAVLMGSDSDLPIAQEIYDVLKEYAIPCTMRIMSAHRSPQAVIDFTNAAKNNDFGAIIAVAGKAAHLAGVIAAHTILPVIGVPVKSSDLGGLDALLSTVQMPSGVPVATVGINGSQNAAYLALRFLALADPKLSEALEARKIKLAQDVAKKDAALTAQLAGQIHVWSPNPQQL